MARTINEHVSPCTLGRINRKPRSHLRASPHILAGIVRRPRLLASTDITSISFALIWMYHLFLPPSHTRRNRIGCLGLVSILRIYPLVYQVLLSCVDCLPRVGSLVVLLPVGPVESPVEHFIFLSFCGTRRAVLRIDSVIGILPGIPKKGQPHGCLVHWVSCWASHFQPRCPPPAWWISAGRRRRSTQDDRREVASAHDKLESKKDEICKIAGCVKPVSTKECIVLHSQTLCYILPAGCPSANLLLQKGFIRNTPRRTCALWRQLLCRKLATPRCQPF